MLQHPAFRPVSKNDVNAELHGSIAGVHIVLGEKIMSVLSVQRIDGIFGDHSCDAGGGGSG